MHLVVLRRHEVELPERLPLSLMPYTAFTDGNYDGHSLICRQILLQVEGVKVISPLKIVKSRVKEQFEFKINFILEYCRYYEIARKGSQKVKDNQLFREDACIVSHFPKRGEIAIYVTYRFDSNYLSP